MLVPLSPPPLSVGFGKTKLACIYEGMYQQISLHHEFKIVLEGYALPTSMVSVVLLSVFPVHKINFNNMYRTVVVMI